jgi:hypothetical protein
MDWNNLKKEEQQRRLDFYLVDTLEYTKGTLRRSILEIKDKQKFCRHDCVNDHVVEALDYLDSALMALCCAETDLAAERCNEENEN